MTNDRNKTSWRYCLFLCWVVACLPAVVRQVDNPWIATRRANDQTQSSDKGHSRAFPANLLCVGGRARWQRTDAIRKRCVTIAQNSSLGRSREIWRERPGTLTSQCQRFVRRQEKAPWPLRLPSVTLTMTVIVSENNGDATDVAGRLEPHLSGEDKNREKPAPLTPFGWFQPIRWRARRRSPPWTSLRERCAVPIATVVTCLAEDFHPLHDEQEKPDERICKELPGTDQDRNQGDKPGNCPLPRYFHALFCFFKERLSWSEFRLKINMD